MCKYATDTSMVHLSYNFKRKGIILIEIISSKSTYFFKTNFFFVNVGS